MKKTILFIFILALFYTNLFSQNFKYGIESGLNINSYYKKEFYGLKYRIIFLKNDFTLDLTSPLLKPNFVGGVFVQNYFFKQKLYLKGKVEYFDKSIKYFDKILLKNEIYYNLFLTLPLEIGIKLHKLIYFNFGYSYNLLLKSNIKNNVNTNTFTSGFLINLHKNIGININYNIDFTEFTFTYKYNPPDYYYYHNLSFLLSYVF